jgi:uncharacterized protein YjbI with pentapeptide repeats
MSNKEPLAWLRQGVLGWIQRRAANARANKEPLALIRQGAEVGGIQLGGETASADPEHLTELKQGVEAWNQWRAANREIAPNLRNADLHEVNLAGANLAGADLFGATLAGANLAGAGLARAFLHRADLHGATLAGATLHWAALTDADLAEADLAGARLHEVNLYGANLAGANLAGATLHYANLTASRLHGADLRGADIKGAILMNTNLEGANLTRCQVYGISVWNVKLTGAQQSDLVITDIGEPAITVDNLEVAQFVYLLLHNEKIREVIDTITSKAVLVLGRFTPERKAVLDAMRDEIRQRNYLPIVFDFEKPASRDLTETISTLAHMARFIIADLTEAKSIPQELQRIVPDLPSVPVQPILQASAEEYSMFEHFSRYPWVLETYRYQDLEEVIASLPEKVIAPAELKAHELLGSIRR